MLSLEVPPLRDRRDDVLPLAHQLLAEEKVEARAFSAAAKEQLLAYAWPGNVRELQNVVKHGAALAVGPEVQKDDLPRELARAAEGHAPATSREPGPLRPLAEVEREHVLRVLAACGGSQSEAARVLGIGRNTLWRKLRATQK